MEVSSFVGVPLVGMSLLRRSPAKVGVGQRRLKFQWIVHSLPQILYPAPDWRFDGINNDFNRKEHEARGTSAHSSSRNLLVHIASWLKLLDGNKEQSRDADQWPCGQDSSENLTIAISA